MKKIYVDPSHSSEWFVLSIKDSGDGISEFDLRHIFEPYYRIRHGANKGKGGLGISICKKICDTLGADLKITSSVNTGTKVTVKI